MTSRLSEQTKVRRAGSSADGTPYIAVSACCGTAASSAVLAGGILLGRDLGLGLFRNSLLDFGAQGHRLLGGRRRRIVLPDGLSTLGNGGIL